MGKRAKRKTRTKAKAARGGQRAGAARTGKTGETDGKDCLHNKKRKLNEMSVDRIYVELAFAGATRTGRRRRNWGYKRR